MMAAMFEARAVPGSYLPAPLPIPTDGSGRSAFARPQTARSADAVSRDSEFLRRRTDIQRPAPQSAGTQNTLVAEYFDESLASEQSQQSTHSSVLFLAQQIAQENPVLIVMQNPVSIQLRAQSAIGQYRAVPASSITYDGPQIELDIMV